jgi:hypothetical protein
MKKAKNVNERYAQSLKGAARQVAPALLMLGEMGLHVSEMNLSENELRLILAPAKRVATAAVPTPKARR